MAAGGFIPLWWRRQPLRCSAPPPLAGEALKQRGFTPEASTGKGRWHGVPEGFRGLWLPFSFHCHMKLHCSQTSGVRFPEFLQVYCHMKLHCSQTSIVIMFLVVEVYCHMKLHCSQTGGIRFPEFLEVYCHMKLHCSQTAVSEPSSRVKVYCHMKLHCSQTLVFLTDGSVISLLPYEITLFSNHKWINLTSFHVSQPYEITLFSNFTKH